MPRLIGAWNEPAEPSGDARPDARAREWDREVSLKASTRSARSGRNGSSSSSGGGHASALDAQRPGGLNKMRMNAPDVPRVSAAYADQKPYADQRPYADQQNSGRSYSRSTEEFFSGESSGDGSAPGRVHEMSVAAFRDLRRVSNSLGRATSWLRVVHNGYGQDAWEAALQAHGLVIRRAQSPAEGTYIRVPVDKAAADLVILLTEINRTVRRNSFSHDLNPATSKSRLQFEYKPYVVTPDAVDEAPDFVRTSRCIPNGPGWQWPMQWQGQWIEQGGSAWPEQW